MQKPPPTFIKCVVVLLTLLTVGYVIGTAGVLFTALAHTTIPILRLLIGALAVIVCVLCLVISFWILRD